MKLKETLVVIVAVLTAILGISTAERCRYREVDLICDQEYEWK
jgi:hypothetical protein